MRDLTKSFFDGGSLARPDYAAICLPNERAGKELLTFHADCFDAEGVFRPEVLVWLRVLAADDDTPLPFGGMG